MNDLFLTGFYANSERIELENKELKQQLSESIRLNQVLLKEVDRLKEIDEHRREAPIKKVRTTRLSAQNS
jgi:hypothetical protein